MKPGVRELVLERDWHTCRRCGRGVTAYTAEVHHRKGRGGPDPDCPSGLVTLCQRCHQDVHAHPLAS